MDDGYFLYWKVLPKRINPGENATAVIGGSLPIFTWTVSGSDFWFDPEHTLTTIETTGKSVTLYAGDSACLTTITVTDVDGHYISGKVRGGGYWSQFAEVEAVTSNEICGGGPYGYNTYSRDVCDNVDNEYEWKVYFTQSWSTINCDQPGCDTDPPPTCVWPNNFCYYTISDGICTHTQRSYHRCGMGKLWLERRDWMCE